MPHPALADARRRIELTVAVRDTDVLPKVPEAGVVKDHDGTRVQVMHNGLLIEEGCYYGEGTTEIIERLRGHHEPQEEPVFHAVVERLRTDPDEHPAMVELGSFWAYYSLWFRHALGAGECVMVEPDPSNLAAGERNFALNGYQGRFVRAAVGRRHGGTIRLPTESDGRLREVPVVTLDGLMRDERLERASLVLCDAQGAELDVLRGGETAIRDGRIRFLFISTHHHSISGDPLTHQKCLGWLKDAGAHIVAEHTISESCSGDGLIVAAFEPRDRDLQVPVTHVRARDSLFGEVEWELTPAARWRARTDALRGHVVPRLSSALRRIRPERP